MPERQRVLEQWNEFAKVAVPVDASREQRLDMRRAFYAGVTIGIFSIMLGIHREGKTTDDRADRLQEVGQELHKFAEDVEVGWGWHDGKHDRKAASHP